jgi:hypothetical protein
MTEETMMTAVLLYYRPKQRVHRTTVTTGESLRDIRKAPGRLRDIKYKRRGQEAMRIQKRPYDNKEAKRRH